MVAIEIESDKENIRKYYDQKQLQDTNSFFPRLW